MFLCFFFLFKINQSYNNTIITRCFKKRKTKSISTHRCLAVSAHIIIVSILCSVPTLILLLLLLLLTRHHNNNIITTIIIISRWRLLKRYRLVMVVNGYNIYIYINIVSRDEPRYCLWYVYRTNPYTDPQVHTIFSRDIHLSQVRKH